MILPTEVGEGKHTRTWCKSGSSWRVPKGAGSSDGDDEEEGGSGPTTSVRSRQAHTSTVDVTTRPGRRRVRFELLTAGDMHLQSGDATWLHRTPKEGGARPTDRDLGDGRLDGPVAAFPVDVVHLERVPRRQAMLVLQRPRRRRSLQPVGCASSAVGAVQGGSVTSQESEDAPG